jgi:phosphoribosylamine--glycine ligase
MKVLVLGSGGREHALAWRLSRDAKVSEVFVYPGNPGMKRTLKIQVVNAKVTFDLVSAFAKQNEIAYIVIGPEKYLFEGWVDQFQELGIPAYGPSKSASFLEESKIRSKQFMRDHQIQTADFEVAQTLEEANHIIETHPQWSGYVLKLSGPALGKGVIVTRTKEDAKKAAQDFFHFKPAGIEEGMVIENCVSGREVSLFYVCADQEYRFLASACDHKRLKNNDEGPNTGGMGAYSPASWFTDAQLQQVEELFVKPTLKGMADAETPFYGTLFLGLMVSGDELSLLEYNTRFGDPETQTFLPRIEGDFSDLLYSVASRNQNLFRKAEVNTSVLNSLHVVKAAKGYPGLFGEAIESQIPLTIMDNDSLWFYAGVKQSAIGGLETSGGRVCGVTTVAPTLNEARLMAYNSIRQVSFSGEQYRTDIGRPARGES